MKKRSLLILPLLLSLFSCGGIVLNSSSTNNGGNQQ